MSPQDTVVALAKHIRDEVRPYLGRAQARRITGTAASGDATFAIDDVAEQAIASFIEREKLSVAYYSEDKGLIEFGAHPDAVLVIDPIDGTRPALAGFEQCVVSVALADYSPQATLQDVRCTCIAELKRDDYFLAERGRGAKWIGEGDQLKPLSLLPIEEVDLAPLCFEVAGRPLTLIAKALGPIIDRASLTGGCFVFNSIAYALTRLATGQLAGVLDIGNRLMREEPATRERFVELGRGTAIGIFTYDIAAAALIASEAGAIVTDAWGKPLDKAPLLDVSESNLKTICAASNPVLHERLLAEIDRAMREIREASPCA
jgi:myo-inositol-1(or 4)-monophosphatase